MCLTVNETFKTRTEAKKARPKVATRNITVFKRMDLVEDLSAKTRLVDSHYLSSPYRHSRYSPNTLSNVKGFGREVCNYKYGRHSLSIERGLHAYSTAPEAIRLSDIGEVVIKCIIPKGAEYFTGMDSDMVSNMLYVTDIVVSTWRVLRKNVKESGCKIMTYKKAMTVKHKMPKSIITG